jgi:MGT family glycosyltransferase
VTRLLFVSVPLSGHVTPLREVAAGMVRRGHDVTFLTHEAFRAPIEGSGIRFVPFTGAAAVHPDDFTAEHGAHEPGPDQGNWYFERLMVSRLTDEHRQIQQHLAEAGEPVVLVTDQACLGGWPVAMGAPGLRPAAFVAMGISALITPSVDVSPGGATIPLYTEEDRARNIAMNDGLREMIKAMPGHLLFEKVMAELGIAGPLPFYADMYATVPDLILQLTPPSFEYPRSDLPERVRFAGVPRPADPAGPLPGWWPELDDAGTVVVVNQGTVDNQDRSALLEPAIRALAGLDALVVVTGGGNDTPFGEVPPNVRVTTYVPFDALLPRTDILITNAGAGGVLKALANGVPMVLAPEGVDKPGTASRVEWMGAGVNLHTGRPDEDAIRRAVGTLLTDPSYRNAARRVQAEIDALDPAEILEKAIGELLPKTSG